MNSWFITREVENDHLSNLSSVNRSINQFMNSSILIYRSEQAVNTLNRYSVVMDVVRLDQLESVKLLRSSMGLVVVEKKVGQFYLWRVKRCRGMM